LAKFFEIEEIEDRRITEAKLRVTGKPQHRFGLFHQGRFFILTLANENTIEHFLPGDGSRALKFLDVNILHKFIFEKLLQLETPAVNFFQDIPKMQELTGRRSNYFAFLLNPVPIEQFKEIALKEEIMPQKSTYFYPKVPSGLLIHKFGDA
jgi:uncharacterized protein (DUF1015 family)